MKWWIVGLRCANPTYMAVTQAVAEGMAIGNILISGALFRVYLHHGSWQKVLK